MAVYLDCNATTPVEPSVATLVARFLEKDFGNAASPIHDYGLFARAAPRRRRRAPARRDPQENRAGPDSPRSLNRYGPEDT